MCAVQWAIRRAQAAFRGIRTRGDAGMSTAEYAVGTIAACAFAALLYKIVTSPGVQEMLTGLIDRALKLAG
ncbi:hypothetical protein GCM10010106_19980 [Thermopolyspora flexuosa]|jgi:hypothetical protein|uniref:Uncharacterized protein DUF4244 n=1 Tax=Thermopolyspora flexuosa TaxID=103836 RepID=A0A543J3K9_9ACTN|nr:DUF4244 domain-containing protein [Thermopolyspora flexuosa]TQM77417.1 uncharacterized protein DUF4244 [Thermopolyspora flexuosa]GGM73437.1 hypothetical protein GCM10010106_19980 [Thermopolyspora flexuosa]